jgi:hypothetical protein
MKTLARECDRSELLLRIRAVRPDAPARWGRMSARQMVCHLTDCCRMVTGEKRVSPATSLSNRTLVKWIALYSPARWPPGIHTRPEVDQEIGGTCPAEFDDDVAALDAQLRRVAALPSDFNWPAHPVFGPMSQSAWLRWAYLHVDHHLRQFGG